MDKIISNYDMTEKNLWTLFDAFHMFTMQMEFFTDNTIKFITREFDNIATYEQNLEKFFEANKKSLRNIRAKDASTEFRSGVLIDLRETTPIFFPRNLLSLSLDDKREFLIRYENNVLSMAIAWAYEQYESFLKMIFIICKNKFDGFDQDFANKTLKNHNINFQEMHKYLVEKIPDIAKYEQKNADTEYNYLWYIVFIEKLRHIIVHKQGHISCIDDFKQTIIKYFGLKNNKKIDNFLQRMIAFYTKQYEKDNTEYVVNFSIRSLNTQKATSKKVINLMQMLPNHALLIVNCLISTCIKAKQ